MLLFILYCLCLSAVFSANFTCDASQDCTVQCSSFGEDGCYGYTIDARDATNLYIECSSKNTEFGGCQFGKIYCPTTASSLCNITSLDYYGTYLTEIISTTSNDITLNCDFPESSCSHTRLHIDDANNVLINCNGDIESLSETTCNEMVINAKNVNQFNFNCLSDYSCSDNQIYVNDTNIISITAEGAYSFYNNIVYGHNVNSFQLTCGSQISQYGCSENNLYIPPYSGSPTNPRTIIKCEGEGCSNLGTIYSLNGALDISLELNGCNECTNPSDCISQWIFSCDTSYSTSSTFTGDGCSDDNDCNCEHAVNMITSSFINKELECNIFEQDYTCPAGLPCIIDCSDTALWVDGDGCFDKLINAELASELVVYCHSDSLTSGDKSCSSSRITCPGINNAHCTIICDGNNACFDLDIHESHINSSYINVTCIEKDSCSSLNVFAWNTDEIVIDCIVGDACDNFNIYANYSNSLDVTCEPRDTDSPESSAYAACNVFNIYATNNKEVINLNCWGDFSCYHPFIYVENAEGSINIDSKGEYSMYYGNVYAANSNEFNLVCRSEYGDQGCYHTRLFLPSYDDASGNAARANILCEGHGCYYLYLYAVHGFADLKIMVDGCEECSSVDDCVQNWFMHCGYSKPDDQYYVNEAIFDGAQCSGFSSCDCSYIIEESLTIFSNSAPTECGFFEADFKCDQGEECIIDCDSTDCTNQIISGSNAKSLVVNCDIYSSSDPNSNTDNSGGCSGAKIYCPTDANSRCDIKCTNENSCYLTEIYGNENNLIDVDCLALNTCTNTTIFAPDAAEINLNCFSSSACKNVEIWAEFAFITNIICNANASYSNYASCDNVVLFADNNRKEINLECDGSYSCQDVYIHAQNASTVNTNAMGRYALYNGAVYSESADNVNIICFSDYWYSSGCYFTNFYLPAKDNKDTEPPTTITCLGFGCYYLNLYSLNGIEDYNFILNGCGECDDMWQCYGYWYVNCNIDTLDTSSALTYDDSITIGSGNWCWNEDGWDWGWDWYYDENEDTCGCDSNLDAIVESFEDNNSGQCAAYNVYNYTCEYDDNKNCVIDCSNDYYGESGCRNKIINTTLETSNIIINCGQYQESYWESLGLCENTKIYCPIAKGTECTVNCLEDDSCTYTRIYSNAKDENLLTLTCTDYGSCDDTTIIAPYLKQVDIFCDTTDACYSLEVEATYVNEINLICTSSNDSDTGNYYWWDWEYDKKEKRRRRRLQKDSSTTSTSSGYWDWNWYDTDWDSWGSWDDWEYSSRYACDQVNIDANYSNNLNILCNGNNSCYYSQFWAENANNINLTAHGMTAFYVSYLYGSHAGNVDINCWSTYSSDDDSDDSYGWYNYWYQQGACDWAMFFIPPNKAANFLCEGYGCYSLYVITENGLDDMNVVIDGCKACDSIDECIGDWYIYCGDNVGTNYWYNEYDYYDGDKCYYDTCDCDDDDIQFKDSEECAYDAGGDNQPKTNKAGKSIAAIGIIVLIVLIVIGLFCFIRRKRQRDAIKNQFQNPNQHNINNNNNINHIGINSVNDFDNNNDNDSNVVSNNNNNSGNVNSSESLARALAMQAMEGDNGTTKNNQATMVSNDNNENQPQFNIPAASFAGDKEENMDNKSLINSTR